MRCWVAALSHNSCARRPQKGSLARVACLLRASRHRQPAAAHLGRPAHALKPCRWQVTACNTSLQLPWAKRAASGDPLDTKYPYVCHAEMNALLNKNGASGERA